MISLRKLISSLKGEQFENVEGSTAVHDSKIIETFANNENNTFLVSFPRTGSHWLRMIMELYFERPSLVRIFYYPENTNYLTLHTHDKEFDIERENVIYLYRDPVDTIYSQLNYYNENINDEARIIHWSHQYGQHLDKWLCKEKFTKKKTVLTYEGMKRNMATEFAKITSHFGQILDTKKLEKTTAKITKEEVKKKTGHDPQVVQLESDYENVRSDFKKNYSSLVWDTVITNREHLKEHFKHLAAR